MVYRDLDQGLLEKAFTDQPFFFNRFKIYVLQLFLYFWINLLIVKTMNDLNKPNIMTTFC